MGLTVDIEQLNNNENRKFMAVMITGSWGGAIAYLFQMMNDRRQFNLLGFFLQVAISCFSAWIVSGLIDDVDLSSKIKSSILGMAGFLGPQTMTLLKTWYFMTMNKFFNIRDDPAKS